MEIQELKAKASEIAREMRAIYFTDCQGSNQPLRLNTDKFAASIGRHLGYKITSCTTNALGVHLLAMLLREENEKKATVLIADSNNGCWRRLTYIKEICHLYIDEARSGCAEAESVARALLERGDDSGYYQSEVLAAFTAIEIMIPDHLKGWMAHEANVKKRTPYQIAFWLKVPRKFVESKLFEWKITINSDDPSDP